MKKHSVIIAVLIMTVIITGYVIITVFPKEASDTVYGGGMFDTDRVHTINIQMSSEDWDDLMERPTEKIKYKADITIDGEQTRNVSCSTKGNSCLLMVKEVYGIDRYSLKIDFGKYEPGQTCVIAALKGLSAGEDPDQYLYSDELMHYFAIQNFILNHDGYTGSMLHNYYLCEKDGRLAIFPWDYNAAFASTWARINPEQSDATMLANYGIDTPLLGAEPEQRPMWKLVTDNDSLKEKYHRAMDEFLAAYFESGEFERETESLIKMRARMWRKILRHSTVRIVSLRQQEPCAPSAC